MDTRDGYETLRLLLQPPRSLCASTGHYPHFPSHILCSPSLPGSHDPGTTSPGEHMVRLRLLQSLAGVCRHRVAPHSIPPTWVSQSPLISCYSNCILSEQRKVTLRQPTCRGRAKYKAESQELCEQRREKEISPNSHRSSRLTLHNQLMYPASLK